MGCSECGTVEGEIQEYELNFGVKQQGVSVFKAVVGRQLCKACAVDNVTLLKSELEYMYASDEIPEGSIKLDIFISDNF